MSGMGPANWRWMMLWVVVLAASAFGAEGGTQTHVVKKGRLNFEIQVDGTIQSLDAFELKPKLKVYQGSLTVLSAAAHGAMVKKGDSLLEIDRQQINWAVQQAENELASARANLTKAEADQELAAKADALALKQSEEGLKNAEDGVKWWDSVDGPQMLKNADLGVQSYQNMVEDQNDELDQLKKMYQTEDLTSATKDIVIKRAVRRLDLSKISLRMQEERRDKVKNHEYPIARQRVLDGVESARQALAGLKAAQAQALVTRKGALANARIAVEQVEQKVADLKADTAAFSAKASADGLVLYGQAGDGADSPSLKAGDKVTAGTTIMRVVTPGRLKVDVSLSELQSTWVTAGLKAQVSPAAMPQVAYESTCPAPAALPKSGGGVTFMLSLPLASADARLLPGMKATVRIEPPAGDEALLVPLGAVTAGRLTVKLKDDKTEVKTVTLGRSDGQSVEVKSGLDAGDEVILPVKK